MKGIVISLAILFAFVTIQCTQGLQIVPPYPQQYVVIEGEPLTIPCAAGDPNKYPSKVTLKKSADGSKFDEIISNDTVHISNSTYYDAKQGLYIKAVKLHIPKARFPTDGTPDGKSYKCWLSLDGSTDDLEFKVFLIKKSSLPRAVIRGSATAAYGGAANLTCNVTDVQNKDVKVKKVMWIKNSSVISHGSRDVPPIMITKTSTRDGGEYVCVAEVLLKTTRTAQIMMDSVSLNVGLKMVNGVTQITANVSDSVVMECPAEGYPLNVTWFRVNKNGQEVMLNKVPRMKDRVVVSRPCSYCRYRVMIKDLQSRDQGHYVCTGNTNTESARHHIDFYVREESPTTQVTTTSETTTVLTTEKESVPVPTQASPVPLVIYIILGVLLGLSLFMNGFLLYKLLRRRNQQDLATEPDKVPEKIEIVTDSEGKSFEVELQPLVKKNTDQSISQTEDAQEHTQNDNTRTSEDVIGQENEREVKKDDSEGKCSSQCESFKPGKDQTKYLELPQNEATQAPNRPPAEGYCSVM